ncbi:MAG TPA: MarR family transcriptional regulator [Tepidisphaeraceae bacterium]
MRFVSNHVSHAFRLKVESHGVTVAEWVVLRALFGADNANPSEIAEQLGMTRGAISKLVDRLIAKKLVKCTVEKGDRRFQSLALTPAGRKLVPVLAALADQNDAEFFGYLSDQQRTDLTDLLKDIVRRRDLKNIPIS